MILFGSLYKNTQTHKLVLSPVLPLQALIDFFFFSLCLLCCIYICFPLVYFHHHIPEWRRWWWCNTHTNSGVSVCFRAARSTTKAWSAAANCRWCQRFHLQDIKEQKRWSSLCLFGKRLDFKNCLCRVFGEAKSKETRSASWDVWSSQNCEDGWCHGGADPHKTPVLKDLKTENSREKGWFSLLPPPPAGQNPSADWFDMK